MHTSVKKGTTVQVILRSGERFVDKFVDKKAHYIMLKEYGKVQKSDLRALVIYKGTTRGRMEGDL